MLCRLGVVCGLGKLNMVRGLCGLSMVCELGGLGMLYGLGVLCESWVS